MIEKEPRIKIFVAHHKPGYIYEDDVYVPIQVGKKFSKIDLGILGDDTGDNISEKNSNYAELTAQYWVWKNYDLSEVDYVGFCHYRRYMTYCYRLNIFNYLFAKNFYTSCEGANRFTRRVRSLREKDCLLRFSEKILKKNSINMKEFIRNNPFDVYTPHRDVFIIGRILNKLGINHKSTLGCPNEGEIWKEAWELLIEMYPVQREIVKDLQEECKEYYMLHRHIFIMKKNLFFEYVRWLFDYLFIFEKRIQEKRINTKKYFSGDTRFIGMFSEGLINYRLTYMKKQKNIKVLSTSNTIMFTDFYL